LRINVDLWSAATPALKAKLTSAAKLVVVQPGRQARHAGGGVHEVAAQQRFGLLAGDAAREQRPCHRLFLGTPQEAASVRDRVTPPDGPDADRVEIGIDADRGRVAVGNALEALDQLDAFLGHIAQRSRHGSLQS
jgi:hypothetical protein